MSYYVDTKNINDTLSGSADADVFYLNGGNDKVDAGDGDDELWGGDGQDTLIGGRGRDTLHGDAGIDRLEGGDDDDVYYVNDLDDVVVEALNAAASNNDAVYTRVSYSLGGTAEGVERLFAETGVGDIALTGNGLNNQIYGNEANNVLDGKSGEDFMVGGKGDDIYYVDNARDKVVELLGVGEGEGDQLIASVSYTLGEEASGIDCVILASNAGAINVTGNSQGNLIYGNGSDNIIDGGDGADDLYGNGGNDVFIVNDQGDIVHGGLGDKIRASTSYALNSSTSGSVDYLELMEQKAGALKATGSDKANKLVGNEFNNILEGLAGNDSLDGKAGEDRMTGGIGDDTYFVDNANDKVVESMGEGDDTVVAGASYTLGSEAVGIENLMLAGDAGAINGTGNAQDNSIYGNVSNNILDGGGGWDLLNGGGGDDEYHVDSENDIVQGNSGYDKVIASSSYSLNTDDAKAVEYLELKEGVDVAITATGNAKDNTLLGNKFANTLYGLAGNDMLDGKAGADRMVGGDGNDAYFVDDGGDIVEEFASAINGGEDTVYSGVTFHADAASASGVDYIYLTGEDSIDAYGNALGNTIGGNGSANTILANDGNDAVYGNGGNDRISGGNGNDFLSGGAGEDNLVGDGGDDTLEGGTGVDLLEGEDGNDVLRGGGANDELIGGAGRDSLYGDTGSDTLYGGVGGDSYYVSGNFGSDTIWDTDTASNVDVLNVLDVDYNHLWFKHVGNNLEISVVGAANKVTVSDWFVDATRRVEIVKDSAGHQLNAAKVDNLVNQMAQFSPMVLSDNGTLISARDAAWIAA